MRMIIVLSALLTVTSYCMKATADNLSLPQALQRTLQHDIALQAFPYQMRIAEAEQIQAATRPNPQVNIAIENIFGSGENRALNGAELGLSLSQLIELGQKRERRSTLASWQSQLPPGWTLRRSSCWSRRARTFLSSSRPTSVSASICR